MECQFFKEIVIFPKSDPFFVLFQTARTLLILTLHWKAMLFWKCLYPYFNFKWLFNVATEVKILLWHTYCQVLGPVDMSDNREFGIYRINLRLLTTFMRYKTIWFQCFTRILLFNFKKWTSEVKARYGGSNIWKKIIMDADFWYYLTRWKASRK